MGILDFLSPALTTATSAAGEYQGAKANAELMQWQRAVQQALMQRKLAKEDAETAKLGADTSHVLHQNKAPVLGEEGYAGAKGQEAGAVASAQVQPHVQQAVQTAQGTLPIEKEKQANASNLTLSRERTLIPMKAEAEAGAFANRLRMQGELGVPTDPERNSAALVPEVTSANNVLRQYEKPGAWNQIVRQHGTLARFLQSDQGRQFNQAADQFINGTAIALEGSRVTPEKVEMLKKAYIPMPDDDPVTLARKAQARVQRVKGMLLKSGRAAKEVDVAPSDTASTSGATGTAQQAAYDRAAAALKAQGKDPVSEIGPRP